MQVLTADEGQKVSDELFLIDSALPSWLFKELEFKAKDDMLGN
jgi:hypothetical protein